MNKIRIQSELFPTYPSPITTILSKPLKEKEREINEISIRKREK